MGRRRKARELALQFLYQYDTLRETSSEEVSLDDLMGLFWRTNEMPSEDEVRVFATTLMSGACRDMQGIDEIISSYSENWKISRMSKVDRNIIRMAIYELLYLNDIPAPVTINEAIELGKKYGTEESGAFINGILDRVRRALSKGELDNDKRGDSKGS